MYYKYKWKELIEVKDLNTVHDFEQKPKGLQCKYCKRFAASLMAMNEDLRLKAENQCGTAKRLAKRKDEQFINKKRPQVKKYVQADLFREAKP